MYKEINLLSSSVKDAQRRKQVIWGFVLGAFLGCACFSFFWLIIKSQNMELGKSLYSVNELEYSNNDADLNADQIIKDNKLGFSVVDIQNRINIINTHSQKEIDWQKVFVIINGLIDKKMVLTNYSITSGASELVFSMDGSVPSNVDFANYVEYLKISKSFQGSVSGYSYDPKSGRVSFSVMGKISTSQLLYDQPKP